jgi:protein disulfide-isomerase A1
LIKSTAEKYKGKLNFATIDSTEYGYFASALNLTPNRFPAFVIEDLIVGDTTPFNQNEEITAKKIEIFVEKYFTDKLNSQKIYQVL